MDTSDARPGGQPHDQDSQQPQHDFQHLKEDVSQALDSGRHQAETQYGQYRDTAAEQIEALAQGAKSFAGELEDKDTLGMSGYLSDIAESMTSMAGNLRGKSAEAFLHDGAKLARDNPGLFIAGSIALGFGLSRFLKAGTSPAATVSTAHESTPHRTVPPTADLGTRPLDETSPAQRQDLGSGLATGITATSPDVHDHPSDFASTVIPDTTPPKGAL
jgi:hypothetical protein